MRTAFRFSTLLWAGMVLGSLNAGPANAQDAGAIVGWGRHVVVPWSAQTDLVAVAAGGYHSLGLKAPTLCPGDMNCDGQIGFSDIDNFVEALSGGASWTHWPCPWINADCNGDGDVTFADIAAFVSLIGTQCP